MTHSVDAGISPAVVMPLRITRCSFTGNTGDKLIRHDGSLEEKALPNFRGVKKMMERS
jgi:hypothetical protein